jgi:hypothetical protein
MGVSGNFTSVTLGPEGSPDPKLKVNGESEDPDRVKALYVAVAHANADQGPLGAGQAGDPPAGLPSTAVRSPDGAGFWTAVFDQERPPYKVGETVLVVGVIVDSKGIPSFWHQALKVAADEDG